jgi:hypothetical protein
LLLLAYQKPAHCELSSKQPPPHGLDYGDERSWVDAERHHRHEEDKRQPLENGRDAPRLVRRLIGGSASNGGKSSTMRIRSFSRNG